MAEDRIVAVGRLLTRRDVLEAANAAGLTDVRVVERRTIETYRGKDRPRYFWLFAGDPQERFIEVPAAAGRAYLDACIAEMLGA